MNSHESYCEKQKSWQKEIQDQLQTDIKNSTRIEQVIFLLKHQNNKEN